MVWLFIGVTLGLMVVMAIGWLVQRQLGNGGWTDVFWTFGIGLCASIAALAPLPGAPPLSLRQVLVTVLILGWSLRLGSYIAIRTVGGPEDVRYASFRKEWGDQFQGRMFWFLQIQAMAGAILTLSVMLAARNPAPDLRLQDFLGVAILAVAVLGASLADRQMHRFKAEQRAKKSGGAVCDKGLWSWSRHPNYFFEWLGWCAYAIIAIDLTGAYPWGWLALSGPLFMYGLLVYVSGIPPLEREMVKSRGDAYRAYQVSTSAFLPLPPRAGARA